MDTLASTAVLWNKGGRDTALVWASVAAGLFCIIYTFLVDSELLPFK